MTSNYNQQMIINLRVIGSTPENGRLCMRGQQLFIDTPGIQSFRRWLFSDSRVSTIETIKNIVYSSMNIHKVSNDEFTKKCVLEGLKNSIAGIRNLRTTYSSDISYCAQLDLIIEEIITFTQTMNSE